MFGYLCQKVSAHHPPALADLDVFDAQYQPRPAVSGHPLPDRAVARAGAADQRADRSRSDLPDPQEWIDRWNTTYRTALAGLTSHLHRINTRLGYRAVWADPIQGGWYLPLRLAPRLLPGATSSVDAFAALLHYGGSERSSGIALLPGESFGHQAQTGAFLLRGSLAVGNHELHRFATRLGQATATWSSPGGAEVVARALHRARTVADLDTILKHTRY